MIWIILYEIAWLTGIIYLSLAHQIWILPKWYNANIVAFLSIYMGALGGIIYCLRGIYINRSARNQWSSEWHVWYILRPITSSISGFVSFIFLKAGLLVLDAKQPGSDNFYGYLAFAFIAGYNVDNFMKKLEEIARTLWGINKTRASKAKKNDDNEDAE